MRLTKLTRNIVISLAKGVCERCGDVEASMHVHHRDRNRSNNDCNNLDYLCGTCHKVVHVLWGLYDKHGDFRQFSMKTLYKDKLARSSYKWFGNKSAD